MNSEHKQTVCSFDVKSILLSYPRDRSLYHHTSLNNAIILINSLITLVSGAKSDKDQPSSE